MRNLLNKCDKNKIQMIIFYITNYINYNNEVKIEILNSKNNKEGFIDVIIKLDLKYDTINEILCNEEYSYIFMKKKQLVNHLKNEYNIKGKINVSKMKIYDLIDIIYKLKNNIENDRLNLFKEKKVQLREKINKVLFIKDSEDPYKYINEYLNIINKDEIKQEKNEIIIKDELNYIKQILNNDKNITEDEINIINQLHNDYKTKYNDKIHKIKGEIKLVRLKFSNMLSYTNDKVYDINFENNKFIKMFGDNYSGKTSIFKIIIYSLYGSDFIKKKKIKNIESDDFFSELTLLINEKKVILKRYNDDFELESDNPKISIINFHKYIPKLDIFIKLFYMNNKNITNIITNKSLLELFNTIFDLPNYKIIQDDNNENIKECNTQIKLLEKDIIDNDDNIEVLKLDILENNDKIEKYNKIKDKKETRNKKILNEIGNININNKLKECKLSDNFEVDVNNKEIKSINNIINNLDDNIINNSKKSIKNNNNNVDKNKLNNEYINSLIKELDNLKDLDKIKNTDNIEKLEEELLKLKENNTKKKYFKFKIIKKDDKKVNKILKKYNNIKKKIEDNNYNLENITEKEIKFLLNYDIYSIMNNDVVNDSNIKIKKLENKINYLKYNNINKRLKNIYSFIKSKIEKYNELMLNKEIYENLEIIEKYNKLNTEYDENIKKINKCNKLILKLNNKNNEINNTINIIIGNKDKINELEEVKNKKKIYMYYKKIISNNGLLTLYFEKYIEDINQEINNYLSKYTIFNINIELVKKKNNRDIKLYKIQNGNKMLLDGLSGYENSILNLIVNIVLFKYTGYLKPTFILLDEVPNNFSENNIDNIKSIFEMLNNNYKNTLIISHNNIVKNILNNYSGEEFDLVNNI